jgi:hypothetical protein
MFGVEYPRFHTWNLKHRRWAQESFHRPAAGILADSWAGSLVRAPGLFQILKQSVSCAGHRQMGGFKNSADGRPSLIQISVAENVGLGPDLARAPRARPPGYGLA